MSELEDLANPIQDLPLPKDNWHAAEINTMNDGLRMAWTGVTQATQGLPSQFRQYKLGDKAAVLVLLRQVKQACSAIAKVVNKIEPMLEGDMVEAMVEQGLSNFQTDTHTLSAQADSYLSSAPKNGEPGWDEFIADGRVAGLLQQVVQSKTLEALCRKLMEDGQELPPGVEMYVKASVGIRKRS